MNSCRSTRVFSPFPHSVNRCRLIDPPLADLKLRGRTLGGCRLLEHCLGLA